MKKRYMYFLPALSILLKPGCTPQDTPQVSSPTYAVSVSPAEPATPSETESIVSPSPETSTADSSTPGQQDLPPEPVNEPSESVYSEGAAVSIVKSDELNASDITETEINELVNSALYKTDDFKKLIKNGQTVIIKPNLVQMIVDSTGELLDQTVNGITTDWRVTHAVVKNVRALNPDGKIYVMEGSATGRTKDVMAYYHYTQEYMPEVDAFYGLEEDCGAWQDFNAPELVKVSLPDGLLHQEYYFNKILYNADVLISIPCLKTTSGAIVTGGVKNVCIGTPPGNIYGVSADNAGKTHMVSHKMLDGELAKWIYDYYTCKPIDYVVVDGLQGFQNGPVPASHAEKDTDKMNMRIILAGGDAVAVDTVCALVMGWDPQDIGYLNYFAQDGIGHGNPADIHVLGEQVNGLRGAFSIKYPNLGGSPIMESKGPEIKDIKTGLSTNGSFEITIHTDESAVKAELVINGTVCAEKTVDDDACVLEIPGKPLSGTQILVYDRFLNVTAVGIDCGKQVNNYWTITPPASVS